MLQALDDLRDDDQVIRIIDAEKERNASFRDLVNERWLSPLTTGDFAKVDPESFGGLNYRYLVDNGFKVNLVYEDPVPKNDLQFIRIRSAQI